jgi:hypothetical protein
MMSSTLADSIAATRLPHGSTTASSSPSMSKIPPPVMGPVNGMLAMNSCTCAMPHVVLAICRKFAAAKAGA